MLRAAQKSLKFKNTVAASGAQAQADDGESNYTKKENNATTTTKNGWDACERSRLGSAETHLEAGGFQRLILWTIINVVWLPGHRRLLPGSQVKVLGSCCDVSRQAGRQAAYLRLQLHRGWRRSGEPGGGGGAGGGRGDGGGITLCSIAFLPHTKALWELDGRVGETGRQTGRQVGRQTDRQTCR